MMVAVDRRRPTCRKQEKGIKETFLSAVLHTCFYGSICTDDDAGTPD